MLDVVWAAFRDDDARGLRAALHDEVAFYSPASGEAAIGAETVTRVLLTARRVYTGPTLTHTYGDDTGGGALFFTARVGDHEIQGAYRVDVADGLVRRLDALFRPVTAAEALVAAVMGRLAQESAA
jgi:hypothetical protein